MLEIKDLHVSIDGKEILKGVSLCIKPGELHVLMGENGSGKSTLSLVIAGHPRYAITQGDILFQGKSILHLPAHERAKLGIFLSLQHPPEIEGVRFFRFLNEAKKALSPEYSSLHLSDELSQKARSFGLQESVLQRSVNLGLSGGEKKKSELLQLSFFNPKLALLDEFDSGLDLDALKQITFYLSQLRKDSPEKSLLLITHYARVFEYLIPDVVHVMIDGKILASGGMELVRSIESEGYAAFK